MPDQGSIDLGELAALIAATPKVDIRLSFVRESDDWMLARGEIVLGGAAEDEQRTWLYPDAVFFERWVPGESAAALLLGRSSRFEGLNVTVPPTTTNATSERVAGQRPYYGMLTPWPRTEWQVGTQASQQPRIDGILIGEGPSYLNYVSASSAFFEEGPPNHNRSSSQIWRIVRHERRGWLDRLMVAPDNLTVLVDGVDITGLSVELTTPTTNDVRPVPNGGRVELPLPNGLSQHAFVVLRSDNDWLDYRYFDSLTPGDERDPSVVFEQPAAELELLIAGGEGQHVEFKETVSRQDAMRRKFLKTVAAFASGGGGSILIGVDDDGTITGVADRDRTLVLVTTIIRDGVIPEPPYEARWVEHDGRHVLVVDVRPGSIPHAIEPNKPQFYVRRGASTLPARYAEISAQFARGMPVGSPFGY